jgi:hypothetical protein
MLEGVVMESEGFWFWYKVRLPYPRNQKYHLELPDATALRIVGGCAAGIRFAVIQSTDVC